MTTQEEHYIWVDPNKISDERLRLYSIEYALGEYERGMINVDEFIETVRSVVNE